MISSTDAPPVKQAREGLSLRHVLLVAGDFGDQLALGARFDGALGFNKKSGGYRFDLDDSNQRCKLHQRPHLNGRSGLDH